MRLASLAIAVAAIASPVAAQTPAPGNLPPAPGSERAGVGGVTAGASLRGAPDKSALEPYLFLWLIPGFGLVALGTAVIADRRLRSIR